MHSKTLTRLSSLSAAVTLALATQGASAADWDAGDWTLSLGGNINTFLTNTSCSAGDLNSGGTTLAGLACAGAVDANGNPDDAQAVQNGLLPASLNFSAKTQQEGWDISANLNVYYGITSANADGNNAAGADALKFSTVDARQIFLTFGKADGGSFKFGRDFGLFAYDAIIADMSLLGAGATFVAADPGHTTLGGLGYGYVYTDRLAQMNYTSAKLGGLQGTVGIFQPFDGNGANSAGQVGLHGKLEYAWAGGAPGKVSATLIQQAVNTDAGTEEDIQGFDLFAQISLGKLALAGYLFEAEGMSSLAIGGLLVPGFDAATGAPEEVSGGMLQATYELTPKTRVGLNLASSEQEKVTPVENDKTTLALFHKLTPALTLVGEYSTQESTLASGSDETSNLNLGAILFF